MVLQDLGTHSEDSQPCKGLGAAGSTLSGLLGREPGDIQATSLRRVGTACLPGNVSSTQPPNMPGHELFRSSRKMTH